MTEETLLNPNRVQEYFDNPALSQSSLKLLMKDPKLFKAEQEKSDEKYFLIGSLVDTMITQPDAFNQLYYLLDDSTSDTMKGIIGKVYEYAKVHPVYDPNDTLDVYHSMIVEVCDELQWQPRWKEQTRVNKVVETGSSYFEALKKAEGKTVISTDDWALAQQISNSLINHNFTSQYINPAGEGWEVRGQVPIYFKYNDVDCKALLDLVLINHEDKTIRGVDVKTMSGSTTNFIYQMRKFRYDIQGAWYFLALVKFGDHNYPDYEVEPFAFVVESTTNPGYPIVKEMSKHDITHGITGVERVVTYAPNVQKTEPIWGINDAIERYKWHDYYDKWEYPRELYESNGEIIENIWW